MNKQALFEFVQIAINRREKLSVSIVEADWMQLFEFCKRQALIGVGFTAVEKLHASGITCPPEIKMKWMSLCLQIERKNKLLSKKVQKSLKDMNTMDSRLVY